MRQFVFSPLLAVFCAMSLALPLGGCLFGGGPALHEIEEMQTVYYDAESKIVYASVISVFQTLGYTIDESDSTAGLIVAHGLSKDDSSEWQGALTNLVSFFLGFSLDSGRASAHTVANALIEPVSGGERTRLRISFTRERSVAGGTRETARMIDQDLYKNAFTLIERAVKRRVREQ